MGLMFWSRKRIIGVASLLVVGIAWYLYSEYSARRVDYTPRMQNYFKLHESELDELVRIVEAEPKALHVDVASEALPESLPQQKIQEIRMHLNRLGLFAVMTVSPEVRFFGRDGKTLSVGRFTGSYTYGYVHVPNQPKKTVARLNEITPQDGVCYVPLKNNWYLFGDFEE
jgi:hypothetical protein